MNEREAVMPQSRQVVAFQIGQQMYALPVEQVIRIIDMVMLTPLPGLEQSVAGAVNIQGTIVPVVDLRHHFQYPLAVRKRHTPILLASNGTQLLGLIVDTVLDVFNLDAEQQLPVTDVLPPDLPEVPLIQGLARTATSAPSAQREGANPRI